MKNNILNKKEKKRYKTQISFKVTYFPIHENEKKKKMKEENWEREHNPSCILYLYENVYYVGMIKWLKLSGKLCFS